MPRLKQPLVNLLACCAFAACGGNEGRDGHDDPSGDLGTVGIDTPGTTNSNTDSSDATLETENDCESGVCDSSDTWPTDSGGSQTEDESSEDDTDTSTTVDTDTSGTQTSSTSDTTSTTTATSDSECPNLQVAFDSVIPTVEIIVDQSGSMSWELANMVTRWDAMKNVLVSADDAVVKELEDKVRFGMTLFTGSPDACPTLDAVPTAMMNYAAISSKLASTAPSMGTPTGEAVSLVLEASMQDTTEGPRIFILVTDGEPSTCADLFSYNGQPQSLAAVTSAFDVGIETYVVAVGTNVGATHLQQLANVGRGIPVATTGAGAAEYFQAEDQDALTAAFKQIVNGVRPCKFTLEDEILPGFESDGTVTVGGVEVPLDDPNGWQVNSASEIELLGTSCKAIQEGDVEVTVEFTCEAIMPG